MSGFVHLHVHSHYSLLQALPQIKDLVGRAKECGMPALALTDNGNLYGALEFYKECQKAGIKPIIGLHAYLALRSRRDKQAGIDNQHSRLVLLARNLAGYKNLIKLVTASHLEGFYYKPRIDKELLERHHDGLICLAPALDSQLSRAATYDDREKIRELIDWHRTVFGPENFFLEITSHPEVSNHQKIVEVLAAVGQKAGVPLVAAQEVFYLNPEDKTVRDTLLSIQSAGDRGIDISDYRDFSFLDAQTAAARFKDYPEALENTLKIAERCRLELPLGRWVFPDYQLPAGRNADQELRQLVHQGIQKRNLRPSAELEKRIDYELSIIAEKGYAPYFLTVADILRFARENSIANTTRGSVAGSIVSYLTFITTVNPLEYQLPFERFLNPERPSPPDIDMDFADNRRDQIINYVKKKYGADRVAQIGTFGTMMARGSVRDVARAMGFPYGVGDRLAKLIPFGAQGFPMTIDRALSEVPELQALYKEQTEARQIIDMARKIEGCARHISVHAAGVVIAPSPLVDFLPLQYDPKGEGKIITQYDMHSVEDAGLLKFDFLGIKNLSILSDAVSLIKRLEQKEIDIENIPLDDARTFELLAKGETVGLFQLNGAGMTRYLKELRPTRIQDINAMVALYRPGPIDSIPTYIERKHNPQTISYPDRRLEEILSQSYGVITYQDDVMMIAVKLAGYSWLEADKLRKAMGKKIPEEMEAQKNKFIAGLVRNGLPPAKAEKIWKLIEPFAAYGFNKAHAASYGKVAYQTAYLKANFPTIYMSAVLTADSGEIEKIAETVAECRRMKIEVLPPSVNESFGGFTVIKEAGQEQIRFGLTTVKNFGEGIAQSIIEERKTGGRFKNLADFLRRVRDRNLNKKSLEALIKAGALDQLGERGTMLGNLDRLLAFHKESQSAEAARQSSLFGAGGGEFLNLQLEPAKPAGQLEKLSWEKELLGLYVSGHPLDQFDEETKEKFFKKIKSVKLRGDGQSVIIGGVVEEVKPILTKNGDSMVFMKISDYTDSIETVIFPRVFQEYKELIKPENCLAIKGKMSNRNGVPSVLIEKVKVLQKL